MKLVGSMWITLLFICGCSTTKDVVRTGDNNPPSIQFTFYKVAVPVGRKQVFTVSVHDADGDTIYVAWKKTGGTLNDLDQGSTSMRWTAPAILETDTIEAIATDGEASSSASIVLKTGTPIASDIGGAIRWSAGSSPYIVSPPGDLFTISQMASLTIDPGVEIYMDKKGSSIRVEGNLRINGELSSPVTVKPNHRSPSLGFWDGIQASSQNVAAKLDLSYCFISYGVNNIVADNNADVFLNGCKLTHAENEGILFMSTGALIVRGSEVSNNKRDGISLIKYFGIPDSVVIADSKIVLNESSGISITVRDTTGIAPMVITGDTISYNQVHGVHLGISAYPLIRNNAIFLNDLYQINDGYGIHLAPGFNGPRATLDVRCNYWGYSYAPADSGKISDFIYDGNDDSSINAKAVFVPWINDYPEACSP